VNTDTLTFLEALFARCEQGFLTLTAIHPDGQHPAPSRHVPVGDPACLARTLDRLSAANEQGWGAYVAVATRKADLGRRRRGGQDDLLALPALFADIDRPPEEVLPELCGFQPAPSCVIGSGRGVHVYWLLTTPTQDMRRVKSVLRGLGATLHGDVMSPAQSMRLVGTCNTKSQAGGALCRLLEFHPERRYSLDDFAPYAVSPCQTCSNSPRQTTGELNPRVVEALADLFLMHGYKSRGTWLNGPCVYPQRHQHGDAHPSFGYNTASGYGFCHVCGTLLTKDLCGAVGIDPMALGGLMKPTRDTIPVQLACSHDQ
jgi:hypothetical protein